MTLPVSLRRSDHVGNGSASQFSYGFKVSNSSHIQVIVADAEGVEFAPLELGTDYSISGIGAAAGGNITLIDNSQDWINGSSALITDYAIAILGVTPTAQDTSIRNGGPYFPSVVEDSIDNAHKLIQELNERFGRSVVFKKTSTQTGVEITEDLSAGATLAVSDDGSSIVMGPTTEEIFQATADAQDAAGSAEAAEAAAAAAQASATSAANSATASAAAAGDAQTAAEDAQTAAEAAADEAAAAAASFDGFITGGPHNVTDGQAATDLTGETFDGATFTGVHFTAEIARGTTVVSIGQFMLAYINGTWGLQMAGFSSLHGVTFSVSQASTTAQLRAALDSGAGNGTIKFKKVRFSA